MKTKAAVDEALARLGRAIERPWDNGTLPSYEDAAPPLARFINRWAKPAVQGSFTGHLPTHPTHPAYPTEDPDHPTPSRKATEHPHNAGKAETTPTPPHGSRSPLLPAGTTEPCASPAAARRTPSTQANERPSSTTPSEEGADSHPHAQPGEQFDLGDPAEDIEIGANPRTSPRRRVPRAVAIVAVVTGALVAGLTALPGTPEAPAAPAPAPPPAALQVDQPKPLVTVDIQGKVGQPGVHRLPDGARVIDAIAASGGTAPGTDTSSLNLARRLVDGEQIHVGVTPPPAQANPATPPLTNLNTAPVYQLDALPGVGIVTAQRIVEYRNRHGRFTEVGQLRQIEGIGPARYEKLKDLVTVA